MKWQKNVKIRIWLRIMLALLPNNVTKKAIIKHKLVRQAYVDSHQGRIPWNMFWRWISKVVRTKSLWVFHATSSTMDYAVLFTRYICKDLDFFCLHFALIPAVWFNLLHNLSHIKITFMLYSIGALME